MADLVLRYEVDGATTVMTVEGSVDAHRCRLLREGLDMARALRVKGPVVVDLSGVDRLAAVALLILHRACADASRAGRRLTVRHLRREVVRDPRGLRLLRELWDDPAEGSAAGGIHVGYRPDRRRHRPAVARAH